MYKRQVIYSIGLFSGIFTLLFFLLLFSLTLSLIDSYSCLNFLDDSVTEKPLIFIAETKIAATAAIIIITNVIFFFIFTPHIFIVQV